MSNEASPKDIAGKTVALRLPGMEGVTARRNIEYGETDSARVAMDLYYPPESANTAILPAVLVTAGYPGAGTLKFLGREFKDMGSSVSWAQLLAASAIVGVTYSNREPAGDAQKVLEYMRINADALRIDCSRIGLLASSGNVPLALSILMQGTQPAPKCAALCYGYMLDSAGSTILTEASRQWGFVNPCEGKSIDDLPDHVPLLIVRAGRDQLPNLNDTIDRFVSGALSRNMPLTLVNHAEGPHAFDLFDDSERSRAIIKQILTFFSTHLTRSNR
jgi:hypothetical protein